MLTHTVCLRRQAVGGTRPWSLVFDDDGYAAMTNDDDDEDNIVLVEVFLARSLYRSTSGELFMQTQHDEAGGPHMESLTQTMRDFSKDTALVTIGSASLSCEVYNLTWPRGGFHLMWAAAECYDRLCMTPYKGERSRWVCHTGQKWQEVLGEFPDSSHMLKSIACVTTEQALTGEDVFLPRGGWRSSESRSAAEA